MNADRALAYVKQAITRAAELRAQVVLTPDAAPIFVSLVRNLESAETDLTPEP